MKWRILDLAGGLRQLLSRRGAALAISAMALGTALLADDAARADEPLVIDRSGACPSGLLDSLTTPAIAVFEGTPLYIAVDLDEKVGTPLKFKTRLFY